MGEPGQGAEIAAKSLFTAASAANAIPVAGQFVSAGLAIAGLFTKIFGGRRRKKAAEKKRKAAELKETRRQGYREVQGPQSAGGGGVGQGNANGPLQGTSPVTAPLTSSFSSFGGGQAPTVQPTQQILNNTVFKA